MTKFQLGIDLGGTNIRAALIDDNLKIVHKKSARTPRDTAAEVIQAILQLCQELLQERSLTHSDIASVGIAAPGSINNVTGRVLYANNLGWIDVPLRDMIVRDFPVPIYIDNDANAAALAEAWFGANRGLLDSIVITLGTGVGGGVLIGGKLFTGSNYAGGELGHMVIVAGGAQCTCGRKGCWEAYSSAPALLRMARQAAEGNPQSCLWEVCDHNLAGLTPEQVFDLAFEGDEAARFVFERYMTLLRLAIVNLVNIFQPEQIAIGGGIGNQGDRLIKPLQMAVNTDSYAAKYLRSPKVVSTALGGDAGILGAGLLGLYHQGGIRFE